MPPDEALVHDLSLELHRRHRIGDATRDAAVERFGEQGVVDLIGLNGYNASLAMVMNGARTAGPPGADFPLADDTGRKPAEAAPPASDRARTG